jgi:wyosine [tRNA(Phe)-imidazoG37] synthetase (radical SAM superfamily)
MSTSLFDRIVFGPVQSRRLGVSLGVNLLPAGSKYCNYNCIYCECGWNVSNPSHALPSQVDVYNALEAKLTEMRKSGKMPDTITFAGNGEPTVHPAFAAIVSDTVALRNRLSPASKVSILSNATMLHRHDIVEALKTVDMPILKLDSAIEATIGKINNPAKKISVHTLIEQLKSFNGQCVIQTMFLRGVYQGQTIDNTVPEELDCWEKAVCAVQPRQVQIYTIARDTPADTLSKVTAETLQMIAKRIEKHGIPVQIAV